MPHSSSNFYPLILELFIILLKSVLTMMVANGDFLDPSFHLCLQLKFPFPLFFIYCKNGLMDSYLIQLVIDHLCHNMFHIFITPISIALKKKQSTFGVQYLLVDFFVSKLKIYLELLNIGFFPFPFNVFYYSFGASLVAQLVKDLPAMRETWVRSLGRKDPLEKVTGYPLQYSGQKNSMDCIVHGIANSWTRRSDFHFHFFIIHLKYNLAHSFPVSI